MEKPRLELKVGLFILVGLALLATLLLQFSKGTSLWRGTYTLHLHAPNVGGIKPRASVLLAGVQVGSVSSVHLSQDDKSVTINLKIYKDYPIYRDSRFVIQQSGFLGDQYVSIIPTKNKLPVLTNNADVECEAPFNLQEVARGAAGFIRRLDTTARKLDDSVTALHSQVLNAKTLANFSSSITNMKRFTEQAIATVNDINTIVNTNGAQVDMAVSNAVVFSSDLIQLSDSAKSVLATNSTYISHATRNIAEMSDTLKQLAAGIRAGRGLAGALLQNPGLATNVQDIAANFAITSSNLNRLGLWGILWSHEPPKPRITNAPTPFPVPTRR